jgi:hypothetical protein
MIAEKGTQGIAAPHDTPEYNGLGVLECINRTILERIRALLHASGPPNPIPKARRLKTRPPELAKFESRRQRPMSKESSRQIHANEQLSWRSKLTPGMSDFEANVTVSVDVVSNAEGYDPGVSLRFLLLQRG